MPEYLAPAVYVEETSFRAKSIEGVSTSTTGFAGPTRKGPIGGTPELLTSFADFARIYGGLENLEIGAERQINYLAHSVRAYFNEGGARLYVSRVFGGDPAGSAASVALDPKVRFRARFPGKIGNGKIAVRRTLAPATVKAMTEAPDGTVVLVKGWAAQPARLTGGEGPFAVSDQSRLRFRVNASTEDEADIDLLFRGKPAEVVGVQSLLSGITIPPGGGALGLTVGVNGGPLQSITFEEGTWTGVEVVSHINRSLRGGYARLTGAKDPETPAQVDCLVIGTDRAGASASIAVDGDAGLLSLLGLTAGVAGNNLDTSINNVPDLSAVTLDDIAALLADEASVSADSDSSGNLVLRAVASIEILPIPEGETMADLGFESGDTASSTPAASEVFCAKENGAFRDLASDSALVPTGDATSELKEGSKFVTVTVVTTDADGEERVYEDLGLHPQHRRWIGAILSMQPPRRADQLDQLFGIEIDDNDLVPATLASTDKLARDLVGGGDGSAPTDGDYTSALEVLADVEDISVLAAPGASEHGDAVAQAVRNALISVAERRRAYRIAVLDVPRGKAPSEAKELRDKHDSKHAALYYPWVIVPNPLARPGEESVPREIALPPSGLVAGIYARTDVTRGVFKAPANEVVRSALRFEQDINFAQQEDLNPRGINCLRFLPGRGYRVWGARTMTSDSEWKYVSIRRYFNYLERSIDVSTQWAVFEPNGERLWANVREAVTSFLNNEWRSGALLGDDPKQAFFVRCDRTTMDQNDLDNGRLVCLIGVAAVKPAEFVIFRIGQKTADARN